MLTHGLVVNAPYAPLNGTTGARTARNAAGVAQFVVMFMIGDCNARCALGAVRPGRMLTRGLAADVQLAAQSVTKVMTGIRNSSNALVVALL